MRDTRRRLAAAVLSTVLLSMQPLAAASRTAGELADQCLLTNNLAVIVCHIYLHAVVDVLADNTVHGYRACLPESADIDRSVQVFVGWVAEHPGEREAAAADVVAHALAEAYPCK